MASDDKTKIFNAREAMNALQFDETTLRHRHELKTTEGWPKDIVYSKSKAGYVDEGCIKQRLGFLTKGCFTITFASDPENPKVVAADAEVGCVYAIACKEGDKYTIKSGCDESNLNETGDAFKFTREGSGQPIVPSLTQNNKLQGMRRVEFFDNPPRDHTGVTESGVHVYRWDDDAAENKVTIKTMTGLVKTKNADGKWEDPTETPDKEKDPVVTHIHIFHTVLGDVMMLQVEAGWSWSHCIKHNLPDGGAAGSCQASHNGYAWKGKMTYEPKHADGLSPVEVNAGSVYYFAPCHDATAEEQCRYVEFNALWEKKA